MLDFTRMMSPDPRRNAGPMKLQHLIGGLQVGNTVNFMNIERFFSWNASARYYVGLA